jgi:pimeloyl-ACP methyl ester carboxylesterase
VTPLVLVPGLVCDEDVFADQVADLTRETDLVVPDLLTAASIGEMAQVVLDSAPPRFALGGISMGGYVVLEVLRRAPERVERVALLDTSARPESPQQTTKRRAMLDLVEQQGLEAALERLWPTEVAPSRVDDVLLHDRFLAMGLRCGADVLARQTAAIMARADSRPDLARLDLPLLVLCGRDDAVTPLDGNQEIAALAPQARLVVLEDCGHLSTWEHPDAVSAALREWLTGPAA